MRVCNESSHQELQCLLYSSRFSDIPICNNGLVKFQKQKHLLKKLRGERIKDLIKISGIFSCFCLSEEAVKHKRHYVERNLWIMTSFGVSIFGQRHAKMCLWAYADSVGPDQLHIHAV